MHEYAKEAPILHRHRRPHEHDAPHDGRLDDLAYVAKLQHSGRPRKLTAAVLLLLLTARRLPHVDAFMIRFHLGGPATTVGTELAAWLTRRLGVYVAADAVTARLLGGITRYGATAATTLTGDALRARMGLIVQAETQRATASAVASVAPQLDSITREVTSDRPCDPCLDLAGTYSPPYPDDLYWSHPRCCCLWS